MAKFGLAAVVSPVSVADKEKSDDFDLCYDLDLTYDLLIFFNYSKGTHRELSIVASSASLRPPVRGGGAESAPPPPAGRVRPNVPAGRG